MPKEIKKDCASRCVYLGCKNTRKNKNSTISFFRFPVKKPALLEEWINNCGNSKMFILDEDLIKNRFLCEKHFPENVVYTSGKRKLLQKHAVPLFWKEAQANIKSQSTRSSEKNSKLLEARVQDNIHSNGCNLDRNGALLKTYSRKRSYLASYEDDRISCLNYQSPVRNLPIQETEIKFGEITTPSSTKSFVKRKYNSLKFKVTSLRNKIKAKKMQNIRLNKRISVNKTANSFLLSTLLKNKSPSVQTFVNMQLFGRKRNIWKSNEKKIALSLYYKSPSCYKFLRNNLLFCLPSVRTIQSWLKILHLKTGMKNTLTKKLALKVKTMVPKEKLCAVLFDEISLKQKMDFNLQHEYIEGYEDLGFLGRKDQTANTALVFYLRGICHNWKIPLCYFTSKGPVKGDVLTELIKHVIQEILIIGLNPLALICDQGTNNRLALKNIGAAKNNPVVTVGNHKLFTIFDVPHLIKSLRNNFMNLALKFVVNGCAVSWLDVVRTYEEDQKSKTTRTMPKITDIHLKPNSFQKMRVKYAVQIFSHSVAASVKTASKLGIITSDTADNTSNFIDSINSIFDALNSNNLADPNPHRRPLTNTSKSLNTLKAGLEYLKSIEVFEQSNMVKRNNIYCLEGFIWSITSILNLWEYVANYQDCKFLKTSYLNQDPLENLFSVIRNRCGYNPTPSVHEFRISLQHNINIRLQNAIETGNCQEDLQEFLSVNFENEIAGNSANDSVSMSTEIELFDNGSKLPNNIPAGNLKPDKQISKVEEQITLETCSNIYVAGYFAHMLLKKVQCENNCNDFLLKEYEEITDATELFLMYKDFSKLEQVTSLKKPSDEFLKLTQDLICKFSILFQQNKLNFNIFKTIYIALLNEIDIHTITLCTMHIESFLKILAKTFIYKEIKWKNQELKGTQMQKITPNKPHRKVRILSNK